jgi:hypothetical protein
MPSKAGTGLAAPIGDASGIHRQMTPGASSSGTASAKDCGCKKGGNMSAPNDPAGLVNTIETTSGKDVVQINIYMNDSSTATGPGPGGGPGAGPGTGPGGSGPGGSGPGGSGPGGSGPGAGPGGSGPSGGGPGGTGPGGSGPGAGPGGGGPGGSGPGGGPGGSGPSAGGGPGSGPGAGPGGSGPGSGPGGGGPGSGPSGGGPGAGPGAGPGSGPSGGGPSGGPGAGPGGTQGSATGTTGTAGTSDAFANNAAGSLLSLVTSATSGDALEAQNIILRRIALEGDVVPSRVPAPLNITQIGGYINLLGKLNEAAMRSQVLAGILGVAGPSNAAGWVSAKPPFTFSMLPNDRPEGAAQRTLPTTVPVRSDFVHAFLEMRKAVHDRGCLLPLMGGPSGLPMTMLDPTAPLDPMPYLGRTLLLAANCALTDPATDALVLARASGGSDPYRVALNGTGIASAGVTAANYDALQAASTGLKSVALTGAKLVFLDPLIAAAGFYPASPPPQPASAADTAWATYTSIAGLVAGRTRLGDELASLYSWTDIGGSIFAPMTSYVWNGTEFAP